MSSGVDLVAAYLRLLANRVTPNSLNRLHVLMENRMTPEEFFRLGTTLPPVPGKGARTLEAFLTRVNKRLPAGIAKALRHARRTWPRKWQGVLTNADLLDRAHQWHRLLSGYIAFAGKPMPEPFIRHRINSEAAIYVGPGEPAQKTLTLAFAGAAQRLMMPIPCVLQHLDATQTDIVLFRDPRRLGFRQGIGPLGTDLYGSIEKLAGLIPMRQYRRVVTLGTSAGGLPAVITGLMIGAAAATSVGGNGPNDPRWKGLGARPVADHLRDLRASTGAATKVVHVFSEGFERDESRAKDLFELVGGSLYPVPHPGEPPGHGVIHPLSRQGKLAAFFNETLYAE
ncbi:MAG: hypothetical protein ABIO40_04550 [Devosia sp.]